MMKINKNKKAFTLTEIVVATIVFITVFISLSLLTSASRTETSKSINYLRALELAQEAIDWVDNLPFSEVNEDKLRFLEGSLIDSATNNSVTLTPGSNGKNTVNGVKYPDDYTKCYYYRTFEIIDLPSRFIKKVKIGVYWNEGKMPSKIETVSGEPDRMKKLFLSTIVFDEKAYY